MFIFDVFTRLVFVLDACKFVREFWDFNITIVELWSIASLFFLARNFLSGINLSGYRCVNRLIDRVARPKFLASCERVFADLDCAAIWSFAHRFAVRV